MNLDRNTTMKLINGAVTYRSANTPLEIYKETGNKTTEPLTDSIIFKYDTRLGTVGFDIRQTDVVIGESVTYKINNDPPITAHTIHNQGASEKIIWPEAANGLWINLTGQPVTGTIELILDLGNSKNVQILGEGITEIVTFAKLGLPMYSKLRFLVSHTFKVPSVIPKSLTSLSEMFTGCTNFNDPNVSTWDTSNITNMYRMFGNCNVFNQPLPWNVSKLVNAGLMFQNAHAFNHSLINWCVPNILTKPGNFNSGATLLTEDKLPIWGTCPTTDADLVFRGQYDQPTILNITLIAGEKVYVGGNLVYTAVTTEHASVQCNTQGNAIILIKTKPWNGVRYWGGLAIGALIKLPVIEFCSRFVSTSAAESPVAAANQVAILSNVKDGRYIDENGSFQSLYEFINSGGYNDFIIPAYLKDCSSMFEGCEYLSIVPDIRTAGKPTNISKMFMGCGNIGGVDYNMSSDTLVKHMDVSLVTDFSYAFYNIYWHNWDVSDWKVNSAINMNYMFGLAVSWSNPVFNRDLKKWCVTNILSEPTGFSINAPLHDGNKPLWGTCPLG